MSDIAHFAEDEHMLRFAFDCACSDINNRRTFSGTPATPVEARYIMNAINGAVYYLTKFGAEGVSAVSENGVGYTWQEVPDWLLGVAPRLTPLK